MPLVLAGPILRRVTPKSVTVWLALKKSAKVTLHVQNTDAANATPLFSAVAVPTVAIGPNLHIVAVTARVGTKPQLQPGVLNYYDLQFDVSGQSVTLAGAVGSTDTSIYTYGALRLPSFLIPPPDINQVRLMQGSCRKPHAEGPDALAAVDQLIEQSFVTHQGRPHQLILGGDQIYADEVADVLLLMLSDAAKLLVGPELMPSATGTVAAESVLPTTRSTLIKQAGFSSDDTRSHLMSLGEYLAMYLFAWSNVLWPNAADIPVLADLVAAGVSMTELNEQFSVLQSISAQRENLLVFAQTLKGVRRALANVPSYMILDDHEITDDFNMTREFCENVYGSPLGSRIIRNGLAAYSLCQHWGNAPEQFEPTTLIGSSPAGVKFLQAFATASTDPAGFDATLKQSVGVHTAAQMAAQTPFAVDHDVGTRGQSTDGYWVDSLSLLFHYTIETLAYQLIVTDTRTWRSFPRKGNRTPPDLIAQSQFAVQIGGTVALGTRMLIVLFTTNFPPCPAIRQGGRDLPQFAKEYVYEDFYDSWEVERVDFGRALAELSRKYAPDANGVRAGPVVVLSGDVHSSSVSRIHYKATAQTGDAANAATKADLVLAQLIASALHNQGDKTLGQHADGYEWIPPSLKAKFAKQQVLLTEEFVGWNPVTTPPGTVVTRDFSVYTGTASTHGKPFNADKSIVTLRPESL